VGESLCIGQSRIWREEDIVLARVVGLCDMAVGVPLHERMAEVIQECGRCYVIGDGAGLTGIDPAFRRYASEWHKTHKLTAVLCHGVSFPMRVIVTLVQGAVRLVNGRAFEIVFVRDEAEGRAWIAAHRARTP
jgi:hypothetical protein